MQFRNQTLCSALAALLLYSTGSAKDATTADSTFETGRHVIDRLQLKFAPDSHLAIYDVAIEKGPGGFVLSGEVMSPEARQETARALMHAGVPATNQITVLPSKDLADKVWAVS